MIFDVGINQAIARFSFEGFDKLLRDMSRQGNDMRRADVDDMRVTTNTVV